MDRLPDILAAWPAWAQSAAGLAALTVTAMLANLVVKRVFLQLIVQALARLGLETGTTYLDPVARRFANVVPAIVVSRGVGLVPQLPLDVIMAVRNLAHAAIVLVVVLALSGMLDVVNTLYQRRPHATSRPIKGYLQVAKIVLFGAAAILVVAVLMDQSPLLLLSGLGAMAAVFMLVFKDTILSLVASVQLTSNDMLRVGDWIEAPQFDADGDVVDIALHTVKVQNFDKTITTIPTHRLIAEPFRNWRGMQEVGARRIMRALNIDQHSVRFLSAEEQSNLARFSVLRSYVEGKQRDIARWNDGIAAEGEDPINQRSLTNIGTFRAYLECYLARHPLLRQGMTCLVRQLAPSAEGLPIQVYCFTDTADWGRYEAIQADIFDHLMAVLPRFGLRLYQKPGGSDFHRFDGEQPAAKLESELAWQPK